MTHKIKSLIYLSCFVFAAIVYNSTVEKNTIQLSDKMDLTETNTIAESHSENLQSNSIK